MAAVSGKRGRIPKAIETQVLMESYRRCCLCFHLDGKLDETKGQIAHIDQNRTNNAESNLAFLCFAHHNEFDSKTSQSKGITAAEVRLAKDALYRELPRALRSRKATLRITVEGDLNSLNEDERLSLILSLSKVKGEVRIINVESGSVVFTIELASDDAVRIVRAFNKGALKEGQMSDVQVMSASPNKKQLAIWRPRMGKKSTQNKGLSFDEADDILMQGYPDDQTLRRFPLGDLLVSIPAVDARYPNHIRSVFEGVKILLSQERYMIVSKWRSKPQNAADFILVCDSIFGSKQQPHGILTLGAHTGRFFRLLALYHDIGKSVIVERHPVVGSHLLKDVHSDEVERELYPLLLGRDRVTWQRELKKANDNVASIVSPEEHHLIKLFNSIVLYHDYFGVLSTGEASLTATVDLLDITGTEPEFAKELFSALMIFNLADLYGSLPEVLPQKIRAYCADWRTLCDVVTRVDGDRVSFFHEMRKRSQTLRSAIHRLWRLLYEGTHRDWLPEITEDFVAEVFTDVRIVGRDRFAENFALFSKLDYCLGFKIMLMEIARERKEHVSHPVGAILTILSELERRYGVLCRREGGGWRRIGIEMAGITRKPAGAKGPSKIGETICNLLLYPGNSGKHWAVGECTAWLMEE